MLPLLSESLGSAGIGERPAPLVACCCWLTFDTDGEAEVVEDTPWAFLWLFLLFVSPTGRGRESERSLSLSLPLGEGSVGRGVVRFVVCGCTVPFFFSVFSPSLEERSLERSWSSFGSGVGLEGVGF